jgi:hypothetical protein
VRGHSHRLGKISQPKRKIEQRVAMLHERAATGFGLSISPSLLACLEMILARAFL